MGTWNTADPAGRPVVFGEVLFDCFEDGHTVLGGAPFNVAWHLQGFGMEPLLLSRVGDDAEGARVTGAMEHWGMDTSGIQHDPSHPTGRVRISVSPEGQPTFDIMADQAYDHIDAAQARSALDRERWNMLYHGSLITREAPARETLGQIRELLDIPQFVDVNLRAPWWERSSVLAGLSRATWAKLNDLELRELEGEAAGDGSLEAGAARFRKRLGLELLILTLGHEGALLITREEILRSRPEAVEDLADSVGAGDAFSAVCILGFSLGWPLRYTLRRAVDFAGAICGIRGAVTDDRQLYRRFLDSWKE
jgi:fructokinase